MRSMDFRDIGKANLRRSVLHRISLEKAGRTGLSLMQFFGFLLSEMIESTVQKVVLMLY